MKPVKVRLETPSEHGARFRAALRAQRQQYPKGTYTIFPRQFVILWRGKVVGMRPTHGEAMKAAQEFAVMTHAEPIALFTGEREITYALADEHG